MGENGYFILDSSVLDSSTLGRSKLSDIYKYFKSNDVDEINSDKVQTYLSNFLNENIHINILIGSGASTPAIPLMKQTFNKFIAENKNDIIFQKILKNFISKYKTENKDNIELFISWLGHCIEAETDKQKLKEIQKIHDNITSFLIQSTAQPKKDDDSEVLKTYTNFIKTLANTRENVKDNMDIINIFTTNYDLYVERSLDQENFQYTTGFSNSITRKFSLREFHLRKVDVDNRYRDKWSAIKPFFRVYKLHGSVDWEKSGNNIIQKNLSPNKKRALIAPSDSKYADSQGTPFSDLFREFENILNKPNSILFVDGYGFPDAHINSLLQQALKNNDFTMISFINMYELRTNNTLLEFIKNAPSNNTKFIAGVDEKAHYFKNVIHFFEPIEINE